eukprot:6167376-Amphidinium_carterae.1
MICKSVLVSHCFNNNLEGLSIVSVTVQTCVIGTFIGGRGLSSQRAVLRLRTASSYWRWRGD